MVVELHELMADINHTLSETFQGFQVIRSFTLEKKVFRTFSRKNKDYYQLELKNAKVTRLVFFCWLFS